MKISTASTRRAVDKWKARAKAEVGRSRILALDFASRLVTPGRWGRMALIPFLALVLSFHFAMLELGILSLLGYFTAKLQLYRFFNSILGLFVPSF